MNKTTMDRRHCNTCTCFKEPNAQNGYNFLVEEHMREKEENSKKNEDVTTEPKNAIVERDCNEADSDVEVIEEHHPMVIISSDEETKTPSEGPVVAISSDEENAMPSDDRDVESSSGSIISIDINPDEFKL